ncbi:MAG: DNA gyrase inhibitor YacG [Desulfuromonadaceae bacterium]|nr:DNA gyrase inhibitor YacG [Desulfuromonadaceae bacterium]
MKSPKTLIVHCPICGRAVDWDTGSDRPFCSPRCRLIDLGNWSGEEYRIPCGKPLDDEDEGTNFPSTES